MEYYSSYHFLKIGSHIVGDLRSSPTFCLFLIEKSARIFFLFGVHGAVTFLITFSVKEL